MIGQQRIVSTIDKYIETNTLPRTLMFEGEWGCGKHELSQYVASKLNLGIQDITDSLTLETLERIMLSPLPYVYVIDASTISIKEQNVILKFLEEPLKNSYIILLVCNKSKLLNTVLNRCLVLSFEQYTSDELESFIEDRAKWTDELLRYARTPGRVKSFEQSAAQAICDFCKKVLTQIMVANYSNVLSIPNKLNFKDNTELFDFDMFVYLLVNVANDLYASQTIPFNTYKLTSEFYNDTAIPHINKQHLFENYLIRLKQSYERGA